MALRFISLENSLSHLLHLKQLSPTHLPMFTNSKRTCIQFDLLHPASHSTTTSLMVCQQQHVLIRHDGVRKPLQPTYDGPYPVVKRTDKDFTICINGRNDTVSVDRLKPAHLDAVLTHPTLQPLSSHHVNPVDVFIFKSISHDSCPKTLRGNGVVNTSNL